MNNGILCYLRTVMDKVKMVSLCGVFRIAFLFLVIGFREVSCEFTVKAKQTDITVITSTVDLNDTVSSATTQVPLATVESVGSVGYGETKTDPNGTDLEMEHLGSGLNTEKNLNNTSANSSTTITTETPSLHNYLPNTEEAMITNNTHPNSVESPITIFSKLKTSEIVFESTIATTTQQQKTTTQSISTTDQLIPTNTTTQSTVYTENNVYTETSSISAIDTTGLGSYTLSERSDNKTTNGTFSNSTNSALSTEDKSTTDSPKPSNLSSQLITGVAVGCITIFIGLVVVAVIVCRKRRFFDQGTSNIMRLQEFH